MKITKSQISKKQNNPWWTVKHKWWIDALLFIGGTILIGGLATLLGGKMFNFQNYKMPPGTAPKIVFPIFWSIIYIAIGVSTFLMWRDKQIKSSDRKLNLIFYFIHTVFNILWPLFFFRLNLPIFSCVWLALVVASACIVMYRYFYCNLPGQTTLWRVERTFITPYVMNGDSYFYLDYRNGTLYARGESYSSPVPVAQCISVPDIKTFDSYILHPFISSEK